MRVIAVRQPWAQLIIDGVKTLEMRSKSTRIRGTHALYASTTAPDYRDLMEFNKYLLENNLPPLPDKYFTGLPEGVILGTIDITSCTAMNIDMWNESRMQHCTPPHRRMIYGYGLDNPKKYKTPIPFRMPKGAIIWSKIDDNLLPATTRAMTC